MNNIERMTLWTQFLERWPIDKIKKMTLEEYVSVDDQDTFTYWLETKTRGLGSIQGNTSIKFGIYLRRVGSVPSSQSGKTHGAEYSWYSKYGENEAEVFANVKIHILNIISAAEAGDLNEIDNIDLSPMVKWKIAFLYQDESKPCLMNIFSKEMLRLLTGSNESLSFPKMYQQLLNQQGDMSLLDYGVHSWTQASKLAQHKRNQSVIEQLMHKPAFSNNYKNWSDETLTEFCEFILFSQEQGLDFFTLKVDSGDSIRIGRKDVGDPNAKVVFATFEAQKNSIKYAQRYQYRKPYFIEKVSDSLLRTVKQSKHFQKFDAEYPIDRKPNKPKDYLGESDSNGFLDNHEVAENKLTECMVGNMSPLNQILYGPPGTGKTYHSIEAAVKAAEPTFTFENREVLKVEYERLVAENRIRFVTFHQSYGYEEFVEGLSAKTENGQISYYEKDGVFKRICAAARSKEIISEIDSESQFSALIALLKLRQEDGAALETVQGKNFTILKVSDTSITVQPEGAKNTKGVNVQRLIDYLYSRDRESITNHSPAYIRGIANEYDKLNPSLKREEKQNYVLIIDEINRGNISKIFGELITLVEPSKREGADEALSLTLPYSGTTFSVPNNLHIIGTMNTADRSLAMMDTALRRRFDFVEMMPNTALFNGVIVDGIDLERMLETMNKRIEVLYDREHTLGHAFFMPVKALVDKGDQDTAFKELQSVFKNKIIPLLEEYFFEDWNKISLVLGDNQKDAALRFITQMKQSYDDIFGSNHGFDSYETENITYSLAPFDGDNSVWAKADAYIGIYSLSSVNSNSAGNE